MISDNQMISGRQASWIFMLDMLAAGLFSLTAAKEQASSLTMLVGSLLTIGLVLIYYKASFCISMKKRQASDSQNKNCREYSACCG